MYNFYFSTQWTTEMNSVENVIWKKAVIDYYGKIQRIAKDFIHRKAK